MKAEASDNNKNAPEYKNIEKVVISKTLLRNLIKFCENTTNAEIEGNLFGHEAENEIIINNALPTSANIDSSYMV